ncbi:hypothetical protein FB45DRAFT_865186 [Roridomyces roridus]|uniref:Uncharacterized protein n=1 Tax=Roridomyces roridus TaxID=1738132 RepID=A0AAD7BYG9_9AGAR|nr:hypothetical protein FB45DRAFT_865186 [Roridomyces roridus]
MITGLDYRAGEWIGLKTRTKVFGVPRRLRMRPKTQNETVPPRKRDPAPTKGSLSPRCRAKTTKPPGVHSRLPQPGTAHSRLLQLGTAIHCAERAQISMDRGLDTVECVPKERKRETKQKNEDVRRLEWLRSTEAGSVMLSSTLIPMPRYKILALWQNQRGRLGFRAWYNATRNGKDGHCATEASEATYPGESTQACDEG